MKNRSSYSRRAFLEQSARVGIGLVSAAAGHLAPRGLWAAEVMPAEAAWVRTIADAEIRAGVEAAPGRDARRW